MSPRFDALSYPGARPSGPTLVYQGEAWPLDVSTGQMVAPPNAAGARVLAGPIRWSVAYGSNANVDRLIDKALDSNGALLLPARLAGWTTVWEARRVRSTGAVPLTLAPARGNVLDTWALGLLPEDIPTLDASEGRGTNYVLGRVGPLAVAARWLLDDALAFGPGPSTRTLTTGSQAAAFPDLDQAEAARLLDAGAIDLAADPLPGPVEGDWPDTSLDDLPLFVYGTLQPGRRRWDAIENLVEPVGEAVARGRVTSTFYGYPAATFGGTDPVHGTLLRPRDAQAARSLYPHVDRIEDEPSLFRRVATLVEIGDETRWAAAYEWNPDRGPAPGLPVEDGRWT